MEITFLLTFFIVILVTVTAVCFIVVVEIVLRSLKLNDYEKKCVLISNCDSHITKRLALRLDTLGFHVFAGFRPCLVVDFNETFMIKASSRLIPVEVDPISPQSVKNAVNIFKNSTGAITKRGLWALINTVDVLGSAMPCDMYSVQDFTHVLDQNLYGPIEMSRQFLPLLRQAGGRIINIGCTPPLTSPTSFTHCPYETSKAGLEGYSDMLRREVYRQGVNVSIIQTQTDTSHGQDYGLNVKGIAEKTFTRLNSFGDEFKNVYCCEFIQTFLNACRMRIHGNVSCHEADVIEAYISAVTDRFPQTRYIVGNKGVTKYLSIFIYFLPDWHVDSIFMRQINSN